MGTNANKSQALQRQRLAALLISSGVSQTKTAEILGVAKTTITRWKKQKVFKELLAQRMAEVEGEIEKARDILVEGAVLAALKELDSLDSEDEAIALRAADAILDRVGIPRAKNVDLTTQGEKLPAVMIYLPEVDEGMETEQGSTGEVSS